MTWTYDLSQLATSSLYQTRFYCGDTNSAAPLVQDEEISFVLLTESNVQLAAATICDAIAARCSQEVDATAGDLSESASQRAEAFSKRAKDLRRGQNAFALPVFGGITREQKQTLDLDTDLVQPSFKIGQDDHPGIPNERDGLPPDRYGGNW